VKLFFDTGAQVSYFQGDCLLQYPVEGTVMDFYPGLGPFSTDSFRMPIQLGGSRYRLQCGQLPKSLESALMVAETNGIVGSELLRGRCVGYFPRRQQLILGHD
jgi:hypothetical protein